MGRGIDWLLIIGGILAPGVAFYLNPLNLNPHSLFPWIWTCYMLVLLFRAMRLNVDNDEKGKF